MKMETQLCTTLHLGRPIYRAIVLFEQKASTICMHNLCEIECLDVGIIHENYVGF